MKDKRKRRRETKGKESCVGKNKGNGNKSEPIFVF